MDGFVPRSNRTSRQRTSLSSQNRSRNPKQRPDGFVPRAEPAAQQPVQFIEEPRANVDEPITIDSLDIPEVQPGQKAHFWQIFKKRRIHKGRPEQSRRKKIIKRVLLVVALVVLVFGIFMGWRFLRATSKVFEGNVFGFFDSTKLRGEDEGRVNILLAGTSEDDENHGGADLTDSIMVASIDTKNKTAFTFSIPRDLWVRYGERCAAGYEGKINVAYQCGEDVQFKEDGYFEGGMGLLQKIVSTNFGMPIHYYGKISYTAFKDAVDAVDGIDITIQTDDPRGIMDRNFDWTCGNKCYRVKYPNGPVHLKGEAALFLARARGASGNNYGTGNDFGRTERQRDMLMALKKKALSAGVITNPAKLVDLMDAAGDNVKTNFKSSEVRRLYELAKEIQDDKITSIDLVDPENPLVTTGNQNGQSIVQPVAGISDFSEIKQFFKKLTSNSAVVREAATVVVLNGSGEVGLAQKRADELEAKDITVAEVGNAEARGNSVVIDLTKGQKEATRKLLEQQMNVTATQNTSSYPEAANYKADFIVIIGKQSAPTTAN